MTPLSGALAIALLFLSVPGVGADLEISAIPGANEIADIEEFAKHEGKTVVSVAISGTSVTKDYVVWREIETQVGEPLRLTTVSEDFIRLENLSIFSSIEISVIEKDDGVTVGYLLREMPWIIPYLRVKYTEQDGFSIGPSLTSVNLFGRGMYLSGYAVVGGTNQFAATYRWPWITANHLSLDLWTAKLFRFDTLNDFDEDSLEFRPWVGTYIGRKGRAKGTVGFFQMKADRDSITLDADREDFFVRVGAAIGYDSRNSWRHTETGSWAEFLAMQTGGNLNGDGDWRLTEIDVRHWVRIDSKNVIATGVLYSDNTGTVGVDFPSYLMYRMGGANSIRGYDIEVLGRELVGQNQFITTVEYNYLFMPIREYVYRKWAASGGVAGALFVDYGNAWNNDANFDFDRGKFGFGFGLRFLVPGINVVRLDIGFSESGKVFFHLGMLDKFTAQRERLR